VPALLLLSADPAHNYSGSIERRGQARELGGGYRPAKMQRCGGPTKIANPRNHSIAPFQNSRIGRESDKRSRRRRYGEITSDQLLISLVGLPGYASNSLPRTNPGSS
jgi:hypothetical protein